MNNNSLCSFLNLGFFSEQNQEKLEDYENLRIPRPWEDETKVDLMRQENRRLKTPREIRDASRNK